MGVITEITNVFSVIGDWLTDSIQSLIPMFWTASESGGGGSLTFLGVLAVCGLAFSVIFLLIGLIQRFLKFGA